MVGELRIGIALNQAKLSQHPPVWCMNLCSNNNDWSLGTFRSPGGTRFCRSPSTLIEPILLHHVSVRQSRTLHHAYDNGDYPAICTLLPHWKISEKFLLNCLAAASLRCATAQPSDCSKIRIRRTRTIGSAQRQPCLPLLNILTHCAFSGSSDKQCMLEIAGSTEVTARKARKGRKRTREVLAQRIMQRLRCHGIFRYEIIYSMCLLTNHIHSAYLNGAAEVSA